MRRGASSHGSCCHACWLCPVHTDVLGSLSRSSQTEGTPAGTGALRACVEGNEQHLVLGGSCHCGLWFLKQSMLVASSALCRVVHWAPSSTPWFLLLRVSLELRFLFCGLSLSAGHMGKNIMSKDFPDPPSPT